LEECRRFWQENDSFSQSRFLHVSTDEVYGSLGDEGAFTEKTPYAPNSPYSASKAGSDFIVRSYFHTYGMNVVTTNCSNNFGPHQHDEKLIPTVIRTALNHESIPVYGKGQNVRDWLYVEDHCVALDLVFQKGTAGETYNIGGENEWKNIDLVKEICNILNDEVDDAPASDFKSLISFVTDRLGHDFRYAIDADKIKSELGWNREETFKERLTETVNWYIKRYRNT
jgi:dTDP-glucose 4,6-dehydratase